jgi:hypothetical protein
VFGVVFSWEASGTGSIAMQERQLHHTLEQKIERNASHDSFETSFGICALPDINRFRA